MNLSQHLTCETTRDEQGVVVLHLVGKADTIAAPKMRTLLKQLLAERVYLVVVDLANVTFLNTPFWAAFQRYNLDGSPSSRLVLAGMSPGLKSAFEIVMLGDASDDEPAIKTYETWNLALAEDPRA
jgi:anti-anti-sigma regulatory factor